MTEERTPESPESAPDGDDAPKVDVNVEVNDHSAESGDSGSSDPDTEGESTAEAGN